MTLSGDGVPKICAICPESYWEEMTYDECAFCGKYIKSCDDALKECDIIIMIKCQDCPRHG